MKHRINALFLYILIIMTCLSGCSRKEINRQVAESIGTLGMYENDEPVETPKMRADKEMREAKAAIEEEVSTHVANAQRYASVHDYDNALHELELISEEHQDDVRVVDARIEYLHLNSEMTDYTGTIPHFSIDRLVVDAKRAFYDPKNGSNFNNWSLTTGEFQKILDTLYKNDYILMDVNDLISVGENEKGKKELRWKFPVVPDGKIPFVLSITETDYKQEGSDLGYPRKLVLNDQGVVQAEYIDANGNVLTGAYDAIPILNDFLDKHPDFSLRGARGIIAVEGASGIFGYSVETEGEQIREIADSLKEQGWQIACQGYSGKPFESAFDNNEFVDDMKQWARKSGKLVGETQLLFLPGGEEIPWYAYKHVYCLEHGYSFFFNIWATKEYLYVHDDYVVQSRRPLNGYVLHSYAEDLKQFFDPAQILDPARPAF